MGKHCSGSNFVVPASLNASDFWTSAKNSKEVESQSKALPEKKSQSSLYNENGACDVLVFQCKAKHSGVCVCLCIILLYNPSN